MFDVGFWEFVVIGVVALVVFGPERLPGVARTAGFWIGRLRRQAQDIRAQVEREMALDDLRRATQEHPLAQELRALQADVQRVSEDTIGAVSHINPEVRLPAGTEPPTVPAATASPPPAGAP